MLLNCGAGENSWESRWQQGDQTSQSWRILTLNIHWKDWWWSCEVSVLWPSDTKSWLIGKDPDAGKDWRQKEKRAAGDEVVGWHHRLNGHKLGQTQEMVRDREAWHVAVHGLEKSQTWLGDWTTTISKIFIPLLYNPDIHPIYQTDYHLAFGKWESNWW